MVAMSGKSLVHEPHLFTRLKPVCVNVTKDCSIQHLKEAMNMLNSLEMHDIKEAAMLEYVLFPFRLTLKRRNILKEEQELICFQCVEIIFSKCHSSIVREEIINWCLNTFSLYFLSMASKEKIDDQKSLLNRLSEEKKIALVKFVIGVLINVDSTNMMQIYSEKSLPVIGHTVSVLLNIIEAEKNQELQISSLTCLKLLAGSSIVDKICVQFAGKAWASFLPGLCSSLSKLFTGSSNVSQKVLVNSLDTFSQVVYIVLNDDANASILPKEINLEELFPTKVKKNVEKQVSGSSSKSREQKKIGVDCNEEWLCNTAMNINKVFKDILPILMCHGKSKVRLAVLKFIQKIVSTCTKCLRDSLMDLLDVLLKMTCDEIMEIKNKAKEILHHSADIIAVKKLKHIFGNINDRMYNELISLPRVMNSANEDLKLAKLQIVKGYLDFFGDNMKSALNTQTFLERFLNSFMQILDVDTSDINIVGRQTSIFRQAIQFPDNGHDNKFYRKTFKNFRNITVHKIILDIISLLGKYASTDLIIDYLIEQGLTSTLVRNQSFLILNELLLGLNVDNIESIVELVLCTYFEGELLKLPITNNLFRRGTVVESDEYSLIETKNPNENYYMNYTFPLHVLNSNIQLICILLEGVSNCAAVLGTDFNHFLMLTLYPILEKVGSTNATISSSAIEALHNVVKSCSYEDITELVFKNSDYLLNSVTLQFRRLTLGSSASAVLCVVLRFCNASLIPIIFDVIQDVFEILDEYQEEVAADMLSVLKHYCIAVDKSYNDIDEPKSQVQSSIKSNHCKNETTDIFNESVSMSSFIDHYCKLSLIAQGHIEDNECFNLDEIEIESFKGRQEKGSSDDKQYESREADDTGKDEDEEEKITPFQYKVVITSLEKCVLYSAANYDFIRLNALDVVLYGVHALRHRENDLLPLIHKLWPPLISRLKDKEFVIVLKAFDVVCAMVEYSGNFMTKRMTNDFLPYAADFLKEHCKSASTESTFTQLFKIKKKMLIFLGNTLPCLDPPLELFCNMVSSVTLYMSSHCHSNLQELAISVLYKLHTYKANVIWLICQTLRSEKQILTYIPGLNSVRFESLSNQEKEFEDNITKLLNEVKQNIADHNSQ